MAQAAPSREGKGGISLPAVRATEQCPPALARGAGSAPPADRGSEAGAPSAQAPRGRALPPCSRLPTSYEERARAIVYVNLCLGFPLGDPENLLRYILRYYDLKPLTIIIEPIDDDPRVAYARAEIREKVLDAIDRALDGTPLEEELAKEFPNSIVISLFDGSDTAIAVAVKR